MDKIFDAYDSLKNDSPERQKTDFPSFKIRLDTSNTNSLNETASASIGSIKPITTSSLLSLKSSLNQSDLDFYGNNENRKSLTRFTSPNRSIYDNIPECPNDTIITTEVKEEVSDIYQEKEISRFNIHAIHKDPLQWIAVFGIQPGKETEVHSLLISCGNIVKYIYFNECNFILVKFSSKREAADALKLNGYLLDNSSIIGVLPSPCNRLPLKILKSGRLLLFDPSSKASKNNKKIGKFQVSKSKNRPTYLNRFMSIFRSFVSKNS